MGEPHPTALRARLGRACGAAAAALLLAGCYVYTPVNTAGPEPGTYVALQLNDRGRVGMENRVGPEVDLVEGSVLAKTDTTLVVRVSDVRGIHGMRTKWSGETVAFRPEFIKNVVARKVSRGRTALAIAGSAAIVGAFIATRKIFGSGADTPGAGDGPGGGDQ